MKLAPPDEVRKGHHTIRYHYPVLELLPLNHIADVAIPVPRAVHLRKDPGDPPSPHANETAFYTLCADILDSHQGGPILQLPASKYYSRLEALTQRLAQLASTRPGGYTKVNMVTYYPRGNRNLLVFRIQIVSTVEEVVFQALSGGPPDTVEFTLDEWKSTDLHCRGTDVVFSWFQNLNELYRQGSDRAFHQVQFKLNSYRVPGTNSMYRIGESTLEFTGQIRCGWGKSWQSREDAIKQLFENGAVREEPIHEGEACPICYEPFSGLSEKKVVVSACGHSFGAQCLLDSFISVGTVPDDDEAVDITHANEQA